MKVLSRGIVMAALVAIALGSSRDSRAAALDAVPALTLEGNWDSNVFNSSSAERSDYIIRARPVLSFGIHALNTTFNIQGAMTAERYARYTELNRVAAAKSITLYPAEPIGITPALNIRPSAYFVEMTDYQSRAFASPVIGTPGTLPETDVGLAALPERTTTREYSGSLVVHYIPTEKIETELHGSALRQELLDAPSSVSDFWVYVASGTAYYRISPRLQMGPYLRYTHTDYDVGTIVQVYQGSLAARYLIREGQLLEARGGVSHSEQNTEPPVSATAPYGYLSLDSTWASLHIVASGEYGIEQGGIARGSTKRFLGRLLVEKGFTPRTTAELIGAYQRSQMGEPAVPEAVTIYTASATLRYLAYPWATVRFGGRSFWQSSDVVETRSLKRSAVFLGLDLSTTFIIF